MRLDRTGSVIGGEGGIRTHGTLARTTVFETAPIDHSGTSPSDCRPRNLGGGNGEALSYSTGFLLPTPAPHRSGAPALPSLCLTASDIAPAPSARMDEAAALVLNTGSHAEPSRPKITISRAMSRLIGRAFTAVLAADHGGSDLRRLGECMTQQIGKEPQSFALPSTFIVEHQAPSRPTPQGC
jgi:hypothetical protein